MDFKVSYLWLSCLTACLCFPLTVPLQWFNITDSIKRGALCNDFSPAGYFLLSNPNTNKWIIFLEGGGGCTSIKQCNARYISQNIRQLFLDDNGEVDTVAAWNVYGEMEPDTVVSKLMTSLWRYRTNDEWHIQGTDLLSPNQNDNPVFHDYNHVLIPYCSSDLWLGSSRNYGNFSFSSSNQFNYDPSSDTNQFTFRGISIFRGVLSDLHEYHGLNSATDIVLAGSSAGGLGALNHMPWLKNELDSKVQLSVLTDSAWFVDFRRTRGFQFSDIQEEMFEEENDLLCLELEDVSNCIFANSFLSSVEIPSDVPIMVVFSMYDLYGLGSVLSNTSSDLGIISLMRVVSEYSGSMLNSLISGVSHHPLLSYYVTSCFQHVYFANSDLWGPNGLLGQEAIDESVMNNHFRYSGIYYFN